MPLELPCIIAENRGFGNSSRRSKPGGGTRARDTDGDERPRRSNGHPLLVTITPSRRRSAIRQVGPTSRSAAARSRRSPTTGSCPTARRWRWSRRAATSSGCACRGSTRRACSARCSTATPAASGSAPRASTSRLAALPAGDDGARDELGHRRRLDHRPRRAADRAVAPRGRALAHPPPRADRLRRRARAAAHGPLRQRRGRGRCSTASRCSTTAASASSWEYTAPGYHQGVDRAATSGGIELRLTTDLRLGFEGPRATARHLMKEGEQSSARCPGASTQPPRTSTRPTAGWCGPPTTGSTGWTAATSPTIPGARTSSAAR